ncbi:hypothetical protein GCM10010284_37010 [Streptomyces rubiginosohelvolus]|uniref:Uncharacterized protein n=1 Tax=Streptomyces rubiginosohelvolus TaxID=67362 RepID=A0ABQ3C8B3_9ACTN|nr:hypothetical protein GCM10010284_37010 [Streptomyces rubiginosohelvolus]GGZ70208.1 hypothetical protein GCM10010328_51720 [Streptomyces pluricolorescens]
MKNQRTAPTRSRTSSTAPFRASGTGTDISGDIEFSRASVRDAQRSLTAILEQLAEKKLALYSAAKDNYPLTGGPSPLLGTVTIFRIIREDLAVPTSK